MGAFFLRIASVVVLVLHLFCWQAPAAIALTEEHRLLLEAWRIVSHAYIDDSFNGQNWWLLRQKLVKRSLPDREATYTAIEEMLASLDDPFTRLLRPEQYRGLKVSTSGELSGVGLQIALDEETGVLKAIAPIPGSPADAAGIQPRDAILSIDGIPTANLTLEEAATKMRGEVGTRVTLTIQHDRDRHIEEIELVRDRISLNPVVAEFRPQPDGTLVGYIRLTQFNANAATEVAAAVEQMEAQGANAYILDLRNNSGGLLQEGIEVARLWLDRGTIVYTVNRLGAIGSFDATDHALTDDPLVVLVNGGTASASEILAGALQDNHRAQLVGETTFGKGLIQSLFDLSDGSGLAVTVAKYETPEGRDIHQLGIAPNRLVSPDATDSYRWASMDDPQYRAALEVLGSYPALAKG